MQEVMLQPKTLEGPALISTKSNNKETMIGNGLVHILQKTTSYSRGLLQTLREGTNP